MNPRFCMNRYVAAGLAGFIALGAALPAAAQTTIDETRDRALMVHRDRGTLAPGTRPKCFAANIDDTVARSQYQCPWDPPNGRPRYPTARSFFGLTGNY